MAPDSPFGGHDVSNTGVRNHRATRPVQRSCQYGDADAGDRQHRTGQNQSEPRTAPRGSREGVSPCKTSLRERTPSLSRGTRGGIGCRCGEAHGRSRRDPGVPLEGEGAEVELASTGGAYGLMPSTSTQRVRPRGLRVVEDMGSSRGSRSRCGSHPLAYRRSTTDRSVT